MAGSFRLSVAARHHASWPRELHRGALLLGASAAIFWCSFAVGRWIVSTVEFGPIYVDLLLGWVAVLVHDHARHDPGGGGHPADRVPFALVDGRLDLRRVRDLLSVPWLDLRSDTRPPRGPLRSRRVLSRVPIASLGGCGRRRPVRRRRGHDRCDSPESGGDGLRPF